MLGLNSGTPSSSCKDYHHDRVKIRFHFSRHGETEANSSGIVCGQIESNLTDKGIQQAKAASNYWSNNKQIKSSTLDQAQEKKFNNNDGDKYYWRTYSSDLSRAQETAKLMLDDSSCNLILDKRLREVAKGVREGRSLELTYDEAMELYLKEKEEKKMEQNKINDQDEVEKDMHLPLLESDADVWRRLCDWMVDITWEAINEVSQDASKSLSMVSDSKSTTSEETNNPKTIVKNVLVVSHSGSIRIAIENLVLDQLPKNIRERHDLFIAKKLHSRWLSLPNTSVTIIDIVPTKCFTKSSKSANQISVMNSKLNNDMKNIWSASLIKLASIEHLS